MRPRLHHAFFALALIGALQTAPLSARAEEVPLWEGLHKTPAMLKADQDLVASARRKTNGDLALAARRGVKLGWEAFSDDDPELAIQRFNQAWLLDPDNASIYWGFALATHVRGDPLSTVERWFGEAERRLPEAAPLYSDHGRILEERDLPGRAITYFRKALALDAKHEEAHVGMVRASTALGDKPTAEVHLKALALIEQEAQKRPLTNP